MGDLSVLGLDIAKLSFALHGNDARGKEVLKKTLRRDQLTSFVANLKPCTIAMEACGSSHYWARVFQGLGHQVRLIPPQYVKPFVKANKNDAIDAAAIAEAAVRPSMRFVPVKSTEHTDVQAIHRVRERLVTGRTALVNEMRGLLFEQGIAVAQSVASIKAFVATIVHGDMKDLVTPMCRETLADLLNEFEETDLRVDVLEERLKRVAAASDTCRRLQTVPGVGLLTATAILAAVPDAKAFENGRQFAAWLGLVPKHRGTGGRDKNRVLGISKRGDKYLRCLLIHGARSNLRWLPRRTDRLSKWTAELVERKGKNKAAVALANKNARILWRLLVGDGTFEANKAAA